VRGPALVAAGVVLLLAAAGLHRVGGSGPDLALPPAPPVALAAPDPTAAAALARYGIALTAGWQPGDLLGTEDPWSLHDGSEGVAGWIDELPRVRFVYDGDGRLFVEDAVVVADPAHCYHLARTVRRVGVGVPPPAGPRIAEQLEAWLEPPYFSAVRQPVGLGPCSGPDRSQWGFAIEQAEPLPCAVPDRTVVCFTLAKWRYDFGARDLWTSTHPAFDLTTGERLEDEALHPGLDRVALVALVDRSVCVLGGRCDGVPERDGRMRPTRTSLVIEFSPGEAADARHGSLRLTIPRWALPLVPTATESGR